MSTISFLAIICVCIELWHLLYFNYLYEKYFKRPESVTKWAESYSKLYKSFIEFSDYYINNLDLQYQLGLHLNEPMLSVIDILQQVGSETTGRRKILSLCTMKQMGLFLLQQFIEIAYWCILFALMFIMPYCLGIVIFVVMEVICWLQKRFNKNRNFMWINADTTFCIMLFVTIACTFYHY